jgi:hypothetical protein
MQERAQLDRMSAEVRARIRAGFHREGLMPHLGAGMTYLEVFSSPDGGRRRLVADGQQTLIQVEDGGSPERVARGRGRRRPVSGIHGTRVSRIPTGMTALRRMRPVVSDISGKTSVLSLRRDLGRLP